MRRTAIGHKCVVCHKQAIAEESSIIYTQRRSYPKCWIHLTPEWLLATSERVYFYEEVIKHPIVQQWSKSAI